MTFRWRLAHIYSRFAPTNRGAYAIARWARQSLPRQRWNDVFNTPDGLKLKLDLATYPDCNMALGLYETESIRLLSKLLKPGDHFVDCGANLGYFTLHAAKIITGSGRVDAFEPSAVNRHRLEEHLKLNNIANTRVHGFALDAENRILNFYQPTGDLNHGQASTIASLVPQNQSITVQSARLDETVDHIPDLIKVDVEGAELPALQGAERFLKSDQPPALIIEHNHESADAAGYQPADLFAYLHQVQPRYQFYWIGWRLKPIKDAKSLQSITRQGNILVRVS